MCGKNLRGETFNISNEPEFLQNEKVEQIVQMGHNLGMNDLDQATVRESVDFQEDDLTVEELLQLDSNQHDNEEDDDIIELPKELKCEQVSKALQNIDEACDLLSENDPDNEQFSEFRRNIQNACSNYREWQKNRKVEITKQAPLTHFFSPSSSK